MRTDTFYKTMVFETCCDCGVAFGMPESYQQMLRRNAGREFYCPNGHAQQYMGETFDQQLKRAKAQAAFHRDQREAAERQLRAQRAATTRARNRLAKTTKRVAAGVCPCCNRTFKQLARHMENKHPEYRPEGGDK